MKDFKLQTVDTVIKDLLDQAGFTEPGTIDLESLCNFYVIGYKYIPGDFSLIRQTKGKVKIHVAKDVDYFHNRLQFAHEIGHYFRHGGVQLAAGEEYGQYLDSQADNFAERLLVPTHLLSQMEFPNDLNQAIDKVAETFDVDWDTAKKRVRDYFNHLITEEHDEKLQDILYKRFLYTYLGYYWRHDPNDPNIVYLYCQGKGFIRKLYVEGCYS